MEEVVPRRSSRVVNRKSYADYMSPRKNRLGSLEENLTLTAVGKRRTQKENETSLYCTPRRKILDGSPTKKSKKSVLVVEFEKGIDDAVMQSPKRTLRIRTRSMNADMCQIDQSPVEKTKTDGRGRRRYSDKTAENQNTPGKRTRKQSVDVAELTTEVAAVRLVTPVKERPAGNFRRQLNEGMITPQTQKRERAVALPRTPLNLAREKLHVSYVPRALPCREKEFADIFAFVEGKLLDGCGGCIYISGVPGTGKTATVSGVIKNLQELELKSEVPRFIYVSVNGMRLTEPRQAYVEIMKQLGGQTVAWEQALSMLDTRFNKKQAKKQLPVVLLVDELDILCTKRQDVVYNLLDWPTKATAQLIIITIANTMDLPERLLTGRVTSRLGLTRLTFQAYTHKQLQEIVTKRLLGTNSFNPDAIQLAARKVASVSGDARRALDICRRAAEIAELEGPSTLVSMSHVNKALNAMITQPKVLAIKHCSRLEQLILQAIVAEVNRTGVDETTFGDMLSMLQTVLGIDGFHRVSMSLVFAAVSRLGSCRLILSDQKSSDIHQKLLLNVSSDDIYFAMRKD